MHTERGGERGGGGENSNWKVSIKIPLYSGCLTNDGHERVEVADVDTLLGHINEVLQHAHSVLLLQMLQQQVKVDYLE